MQCFTLFLSYVKDFDAWFNTNSLVEEQQLVNRLHSVSTCDSKFSVLDHWVILQNNLLKELFAPIKCLGSQTIPVASTES